MLKNYKKQLFALLLIHFTLLSNFVSAQKEVFHLPFDGDPSSTEGEFPALYGFLGSTGIYGPGKIGQAQYITSSDYLIYTAPNNIDAQKGTLEFWLKPDTNWVPNGEFTILEFGGAGGMLFEKDAANNLRLIINRYAMNGQPEVDVAYNQQWTPGEWYHIAYTWGSDTLRLFVNGAMVDQDVYAYPFPVLTDGYFNVSYDGAGAFGGLDAYMDDLIIYDSVKTVAQIKATYDSATVVIPPTVCPSLLKLNLDFSLVGADGETPIDAYGINFVPGKISEGVSFTEQTELRYAKLDNFNEFEGSLDFWVNPNNNWASNEEYTILECGGDGGMIFEKDGANNLRLIINRFAVNGQPEVDVAYNVWQWDLSKWYHVAYTWGNGNLYLYVNGVLVDSDNYGVFSFPAINATYFRIGDDDVHGEGPLRASLDEIEISGCAMSATEINDIYQAGRVNTTTSILDANKTSNFQPYPNPATGFVSFNLKNSAENVNIEIEDQAGKSMLSLDAKGNDYVTVDISTIPSGMYFAKISSGGVTIGTEKLIVK